MFGLQTTVEPAVEPLETADAKAQLRLMDDSEDAFIDALIVAARQYVEVATGRALITQTLRLSLDCFPAGVIHLPKPPLQTVSSVVYIDSTGSTITLANNTDYRYDAYTEPGRIEPVTNWPAADDRLAAVQVTYVAGYGLASDIPRTIKQAMLLLVSHWYENRSAVGNVGKEVELAVKSLLGVNWSGAMVGTYP